MLDEAVNFDWWLTTVHMITDSRPGDGNHHTPTVGTQSGNFQGWKKNQRGRRAFAEISSLISHLCVSSPLWSFYQFQHNRGSARMPDWRIVCQVSHVFQVSARNPHTSPHQPPSTTSTIYNTHRNQALCHADRPGLTGVTNADFSWCRIGYQWQSNLQCLHRAGGNELI